MVSLQPYTAAILQLTSPKHCFTMKLLAGSSTIMLFTLNLYGVDNELFPSVCFQIVRWGSVQDLWLNYHVTRVKT